MPAEGERRRPDFGGGAPVVLADGQTWHLARPVVEFAWADNDAGYAVHARLGDGPGYGAAFRAWEEAPEGTPVIGLVFRMARLLLLANYELTDEEVSALLRVDNSEAGRARRDALVTVATGGDLPKAGPSGPGDGGPR